MDRRPQRSIEQIEVIEHRIVEEGRRPVGTGGALPPYSAVRRPLDAHEQRDISLDRRYDVTGERDVSRDASFIHTSANYGQQIEASPSRCHLFASGQTLNSSGSRLNTSGQRVEFADISESTPINNYGYDIHEIHTSAILEGGARVVETHGSGPLLETSRLESTRIEEIIERPATRANGYRTDTGYSKNEDFSSITPEALRVSSQSQVFTVPSPPMVRTDSWRQIQSDQDAFVRKDSYRKMQQSDDLIGSTENSKSYAVSFLRFEQFFSWNLWTARLPLVFIWKNLQGIGERITCLCISIPLLHGVVFRERDASPRLLASLCCILFLLLLLLILIGIILNAIFNTYSVSEFLLYPPVCEECRRKNPNVLTVALPSSLFIHIYSSSQAHFELRGNLPFKSNSFTAIDFETIQAHFGWQEFWQFDAEPIEPVAANSKFADRIADCVGVKWYYLKQTVHSRDAACSDCYDFCLPDWAVVRKEKYEDQSTIGVRRLDCFRLYVPEWKNFRVETDASGGHWQYPLASQSTKRDKSGNWVSWVPTGNSVQSRRRR
ncbi:unnamed protein product [Angiostrongylus costaricensis]|uniref:SUN domain-containing protein n=1 Tax=Angiostrongylus costaricensis TaxID=334426 RepID=A0A158PDU5_ANGCS|nr:unnamed protein product [Angiostrongylus costaricensis]